MKSLKYQILVIITFFIVSGNISAQNLDEIISKHLKAHGDLTKWEAIENIEIKARFTAFSEEADFYSVKTKKGEYYSELTLGQHDVIEAFNGTSGWTIDPWQEILFPRELNKSEINVFYQKSDFFTPFYKYKEKGFKAELIGNVEEDGVDLIAIKLSRTNNKVETWYLDAETFLEYKCESQWIDFASPAPAESYFDDFRNVDGLIIPFFVERIFWQRDRILQIEEVKFNADIDENLFEMPRSEGISKLAFMQGEWDVSVEKWSQRRNVWRPIDKTNSIIKWESTNLLQEKMKFDQYFVQSKIINYSFNVVDEKYQMLIFDDFSSSFAMFEGTENDTIVEFTKINCMDSIQNTPITKVVIANIKNNSFIIEFKQSSDNGTNWQSNNRFSYVRK
jgi:hypothetical protein